MQECRCTFCPGCPISRCSTPHWFHDIPCAIRSYSLVQIALHCPQHFTARCHFQCFRPISLRKGFGCAPSRLTPRPKDSRAGTCLRDDANLTASWYGKHRDINSAAHETIQCLTLTLDACRHRWIGLCQWRPIYRRIGVGGITSCDYFGTSRVLVPEEHIGFSLMSHGRIYRRVACRIAVAHSVVPIQHV